MRALLLSVFAAFMLHAHLVAQTATISGTVMAEQTGEALGNVLVYLAGTTRADTTAPDGSFRIDSVSPGQHDLAWHHPLLDPPSPVSIEVQAGRDTTLRLRVPLPAVIAAGCSDRTGSAIWGRLVAEESGVPMPGVRVQLRAGNGARDSSRAGMGEAVVSALRDARSEPDGSYRFCGIPAGEWVVDAGLPGADRSSVAATVAPGTAVRQDLRLNLPARDDGRARVSGRVLGRGKGTARVIGTVIDEVEGKPVAGALVDLGDSIRLLTDYRGRFLARDVGRRLLPLRVTHAGFEPVEDTVVVQAGELAELEVRLGPVTLDAITVTARRRGIMTDVYWRANQQLGGIYLTAEDIQARAPVRTTDVVRSESSVRIFGSGSGRIGQLELRGGCAPHVYLDGIRITVDRDVLSPSSGFSPGYRTQAWALADSYAAVNLVHPSSIEMIEIYRGASEVPAEFGGSLGMCGAIAIWTRRGGGVRGGR